MAQQHCRADPARHRRAVIATLEQKLPTTRILLLGLLPSDVSPEKSRADAEVNRYLAERYGDNPRVTYLEIGSIFRRNGQLDTTRFYDTRFTPPAGALHPDTQRPTHDGRSHRADPGAIAGEPRAYRSRNCGTRINTALIPVPWLEQDSYDWMARHHGALAAARSLRPEVVMIGDSITHFWSGPPRGVRASGPESRQWLCWRSPGAQSRLRLGSHPERPVAPAPRRTASGLAPKWVVVNIGTNNLAGTWKRPHQHSRQK